MVRKGVYDAMLMTIMHSTRARGIVQTHVLGTSKVRALGARGHRGEGRKAMQKERGSDASVIGMR